MADHARHRAPRTRAAWRARGPGWPPGRALVGAALSGVLAVGLLVSPTLCWWSSAGSPPPEPAATVVRPVTWALREGPLPPPVRAVDTAAVLAGVDAAVADSGALVAAVVIDPLGRTLVRTPEAGRPLLSASLVKLLVVQQVLARAGPGGEDAGTVDRMRRAVTSSDDGAMSALWSTFDGAALVRDAAAAFGLTGTAPPDVPGQWGQSTTTAVDVARFLAALTAVPGPPGAAELLGWMQGTTPVAADGFDQTFGVLSGPGGAGVAAKQGWMCCVGGRRQLHSAGVLADGRVVVVLSDLPVGVGWGAAAAVVDGATAALVAGTR